MELPSNRRRDYRVPLTETVILFKGGQSIGELRTRNLSLGGALLAGKHALVSGDAVEGILLLPRRLRVWFPAVVVRVGWFGEEQYAAVAFSELAAASEEAIQAVIEAKQASDSRASALILCDTVATRSELEFGIKIFGRTCVTIDSAFEAMRLLEQPNRVWVMLVALELNGGMDGREVLDYVADEYPAIRRVLVCEGEPSPPPPPEPTLQVLVRPWSRATLGKALTGLPDEPPAP
jgi:hypothetical protein